MEKLTWETAPDSIIFRIFSHLAHQDLYNASLSCKSWLRVSLDEFLWRDLFRRTWKLDDCIGICPSKTSWREEYKRLYYHTPVMESQELTQHKEQVLHVSFSHNGQLFATCSKDGHVHVWNWSATGHASRRYSEDMSEFSWKYTQFSCFNASDTLLMVSGVHFGLNSTTGEICVFDITGESLVLQCRVANKPYDIFGAWYDDNYLLSGNLHYLEELLSYSSLSLNKASQETDSEEESVTMKIYQFFNENASSIRTILVANVPNADMSEGMQGYEADKPTGKVRTTLAPSSKSNLLLKRVFHKGCFRTRLYEQETDTQQGSAENVSEQRKAAIRYTPEYRRVQGNIVEQSASCSNPYSSPLESHPSTSKDKDNEEEVMDWEWDCSSEDDEDLEAGLSAGEDMKKLDCEKFGNDREESGKILRDQAIQAAIQTPPRNIKICTCDFHESSWAGVSFSETVRLLDNMQPITDDDAAAAVYHKPFLAGSKMERLKSMFPECPVHSYAQRLQCTCSDNVSKLSCPVHLKAGTSAAAAGQTENDTASTTTKWLIFTAGSKTFTPHQIGLKKMTSINFVKSTSVKMMQRLFPDVHEDVFDQDAADGNIMRHFDKPDHLIDLNGHIIGMALSPDHRYLYVNNRPWPAGFEMENPLNPPPISQEIDIHVIDLVTMTEVGKMHRSHKAYTPNDECFFIFLDVCREYVASGAEDHHGYLWDRHYGSCLATFGHSDVVNCVAFNPLDPESLVTVSDDWTIKVWHSRNRARQNKKEESEQETSADKHRKVPPIVMRKRHTGLFRPGDF